VLRALKTRLHDDGLTIKDVQRLYKEEGLERISRAIAEDPTVPKHRDVGSAFLTEGPAARVQIAGKPQALTSESQMRLRLSLAGLLSTKQRLDHILQRRFT